MQIRGNRFGAVVCALVGALCLAPALATSARSPGHNVTHKATVHSAKAKKAAQQRPRVSAAAKVPRSPVHAKPAAARKAGQPRAALAQRRSGPQPRAVRVQRKPTVAQRAAPQRAARPLATKKPQPAATQRLRPGVRPVAKARGAAPAQHAAHKPTVRRPSGHKKTAH